LGCASKSVLDPLIIEHQYVILLRLIITALLLLFHKLNMLTLNDGFKLEILKLAHDIQNNEHLPH